MQIQKTKRTALAIDSTIALVNPSKVYSSANLTAFLRNLEVDRSNKDTWSRKIVKF